MAEIYKRLSQFILASTIAFGSGSANPEQSHIIPQSGEQTEDAKALMEIIENVKDSESVYSLKDDQGVSMDCLEVVSSSDGYLAVYHGLFGSKFEGRLAISSDLSDWKFINTLSDYASQLTLFPTKNGGYIVGLEKNTFLDGSDNGSNLQFSYYKDLESLYKAEAEQTFLIPRSLSVWNEGTPNIFSVDFDNPNDPDINRSRIQVGFHYYDTWKGADQEARGVITNFSTWNARSEDRINSWFENQGAVDVGDRSSFVYKGTPYVIYEARNSKDFADWKPYLLDSSSGVVTKLNLKTQNGSKSFANPTLEIIDEKIIVTSFLPHEGAAKSEAGELVYSAPLPR